MRVAIGCLDFTRQRGIGRSVVELTEWMVRLGHEVHCHCANWDGTLQSPVHLHRVRTIGPVNTSKLVSFAIACRSSIRKEEYDITHSMGNLVGCDILTAHSCHKAGLKALNAKIGPADRFRLFIERRNYVHRRYRHIIAVAQGVKDELIHHYGVPSTDISVIPNGVDLEEFSPSNKRIRWSKREELGLSRDDLVAILVANEFGRKGLDLVIEALSRVHSMNIRLIVAGGDDPSQYLKLASDLSVADRVFFVGSVSDIDAYYAASDVFVFPSSYEAFSLATLEAAASGLPLITTRINGTEELVEDGVNGFFVGRNPNAIAARLGEVLGHPDLRRRLSANARKSAEPFSWESVARKTLEVYQRVQGLKHKNVRKELH